MGHLSGLLFLCWVPDVDLPEFPRRVPELLRPFPDGGIVTVIDG